MKGMEGAREPGRPGEGCCSGSQMASSIWGLSLSVCLFHSTRRSECNTYIPGGIGILTIFAHCLQEARHHLLGIRAAAPSERRRGSAVREGSDGIAWEHACPPQAANGHTHAQASGGGYRWCPRCMRSWSRQADGHTQLLACRTRLAAGG